MFRHPRHLAAILCIPLLTGCASKKLLRQPIADAAPVHSAAFKQAMGNLIGSPFRGGNKITTLINGDQISPAMLTGNAVAMGEAAGVTAALAATSKRLPHEVAWSEGAALLAKIRRA